MNFDMLDINLEEFDRLYTLNKHLFNEIDNWFYFKNDSKTAPNHDFVRCGNYCGERSEEIGPEDSYSAAVLVSKISEFKNLKDECKISKDGLVRFKLKDAKTDAFFGILKNLDGTQNACFVVKNDPKTMDLVFSKNGSTNYADASKEVGTIPYMVENDFFVDMIPNEILNLIGITQKQTVISQDLSK